ncbi:T9SS type A sorting domain-containing protein [candidate division TA06 bacterium]|nr:T9SS type A sorting domain-containing protein [candidate division TA06 bacterium]
MAVEETVAVRDSYSEIKLSQNSPNPFQLQTIIEYQLPQTAELSIKIYNLLGQVVKTLVEKKQQAGYYTILWDGRDEARRQVTSGVYFFRFTSKNFSKTRKIILLR